MYAQISAHQMPRKQMAVARSRAFPIDQMTPAERHAAVFADPDAQPLTPQETLTGRKAR